MKTFALLLSLISAAALFTSCSTGGAYEPKNATKFNQEDTSKFVLLDAGAQRSVTCSGLQTGRTADGRLKVSANLRNRENRRIEVQANCVFKDAQNFTLDETPFRPVFLDENATQGISFEAFNTNAVNYTIRVREAR
ncbi:MAG TPA: YcfL family protein [Candidatus Limnocylindria bacterium]|nr:YcfL family protein [Candidatus Limnocylindria bacterium]